MVFKIKMQYTGIMAFKKKSAQSLWKQKKKNMAVLAEFPIFRNPSWASGAKNYVIIIIGTLSGNSILFLNRYIIPQKDLGWVVLSYA